MNNVQLYGNLTKDPYIRYIERNGSRVAVANFTIATHRRFKKTDGTKGEDTAYIDCEAWASGAETIAKFVNKGDALLITGGSLKNDNYEKDGVMQYRMRVRVERFDLMPKREKNGNNGNGDENTSSEDAYSAPDTVQNTEPVSVADGTDIPF